MIDREKMIEEIEKVLQLEQMKIANTTEEFAKLQKVGITRCNAEALYNAGCLKISEDEVVLTKEEYERLKALPEKVHAEMDERMKEEIAIEKRMGEDKLERFENNMKNVLEIEKEQVRKETAREIIRKVGTKNLLKKGELFGDLTEQEKKVLKVYADRLGGFLRDLAKQYGVEVEE